MSKKGVKVGGGSRKGIPNKATALLKDMILQALDESGGVSYLRKQAQETPAGFMTLLGKVLPTQVTGADGGPLEVKQVNVNVIDPNPEHSPRVQAVIVSKPL